MRLSWFSRSTALDVAPRPVRDLSRRRTRPHRSPRILACSWGFVEVAGHDSLLRDAMLFPGGARSWDWRTYGTGHRAGIQVGDVRELLERGVAEIVLSRGRLGLLCVAAETLEFLAQRGVPVHVLRTKAAVERYNEIAATSPRRAVGALIHSTC